MPFLLDENQVVTPSMDQSDALLHALIRRDHFIEPLGRRLPYFLSNPTKDPSMGQGQSIRKLFQNKTNGFFIECGALDGETRSNTLSLERDLQWTGILIEGDPKSIPKILSKGRKSYVVPHCLATKNITMKVSYGSYFNLGRIVDESPGKKDKEVVDVMCLPLFAILNALKVPQVDYFSLDVEGNELDVLKTIPWDEVNILALSVEFTHIGESHTTGTKSELQSFMESKGYRIVSKVTNGHQLANDFIFAKNGLFDDISIADVIS
ncbi:hypothetical protein TCAL_06874 [Tigriopus californicus]|uniref:Methyltransferase FkbM domain-containing protein n=2 Tax=Tigriopus californicus TaxID=6832 RepID=A0A553PGN0_TIGCA|nr:hypothetical protein TCAL_06874 [Tigriopus californicus]